MILPATLERVDARLTHLVHHSLVDSRTVITKQEATSTAPQVHCERIPAFTDEPVLITDLDPPVAENAALSIYFDRIPLLVDHRNNRALPRRQIPALENHRSRLSTICHHTNISRVARLDARHRDHVPLTGELSLSRHQAVDHWRDANEAGSITIAIIQLNNNRQLLRLRTIIARLRGVGFNGLLLPAPELLRINDRQDPIPALSHVPARSEN